MNSKTEMLSLEEQIELEYQRAMQELEQNEIQKQEILNRIIEMTTYQKGVVTKEVWKIPMPTSVNFLDNKSLNIRTYGALMLESNWGGKFLNENDRYIYKEKYDEAIEKITCELNISKSTMKRHINKLKKCDIKAIELIKTGKGDLVYKLNYGVPTGENTENFKYEKYVTITNVALRKLVNAYSEYALRIYLYLNYRCHKKPICYIKQEEICEAVGLKYTSRAVVTDCVNALVNGGFIRVDIDFKNNVNAQGTEHLIPNYYYSLSEQYLIN